MKKPVLPEVYERMLSYQRNYYATMPDEQRAKYKERKHLYYLAKKQSVKGK